MKKYTSAYFYVIINSKEIFISYEFDKSGFDDQNVKAEDERGVIIEKYY